MGIWVEYTRRWAPAIAIMSAAMYLQYQAAKWTLERPQTSEHPGRRRLVWTLLFGAWGWMLASMTLTSFRVSGLLSPVVVSWIEALSLLLAILSVSVFLHAWFVRRGDSETDMGRRRILGAVKTAVVGAPMMAAGYGVFHERFQLELREVRIAVPGLPKDLDGLRIAQISDIHRGAFFSRAELDRAVAMANEAKPHLTVVTGDLITRLGDPLDDCLASLKALRSDAGVFGCHGNHEVYANCADYATARGLRQGLRFLRMEAQSLRFGAAVLNLAGVDYQRLSLPYLTGAEQLVRPGAFNLLLSHNPDVFPIAVQKGFQLTLAGHTHGGQINVEILNDNLNLARFFTPYVLGEYRQGDAAIYVTPGLGTVGIPMRLGSRPELTVIRLCAA